MSNFDYDTAMADPDNHVFINVTQSGAEDKPENMEGWADD